MPELLFSVVSFVCVSFFAVLFLRHNVVTTFSMSLINRYICRHAWDEDRAVRLEGGVGVGVGCHSPEWHVS